MPLSRNFVYNLQRFRGFCEVHFTSLLQIQHENNFLPTSEHRQAKVGRFLRICLCDCFIYRTNFVFQKYLEMRRHLGCGRKTVSSHMRIFRVTGANKNARKLLFTDLVNTNTTNNNNAPF